MTFIIIAVIVGLAMAMAIGANDVANSMATAVGAKAITIKQAVIIASICEFSGAFFFGKMVTNTIRKGIVNPELIKDPHVLAAGAFAALISATIWVFVATRFSLPISTTHSIVGGMTGFGIVALGWGSVYWMKILLIISSWFLSPLLGGILGYAVFKAIVALIFKKKSPLASAKKVGPFLIGITFFIFMWMFFSKVLHNSNVEQTILLSLGIGVVMGIIGYFLLQKIKHNEDEYISVEKMFKKLQIMTSCYVSVAHGSNDVANAIGPLAAIYAVWKYGEVATQTPVPKMLLVLGGIGISIGVAVWGHKVMKSVGEGITDLNNSRGFSVDFSAATTVFIASVFGLPVSSTHIVIGSITGVGFARGFEALNIGFLKQIGFSWLLTVPLAGLTSALLYKVIILFF